MLRVEPTQEPAVRRGAQHRQAPPAPALAQGHPARRQGRRRDREGGADPRLQRDDRRPQGQQPDPGRRSSAASEGGRERVTKRSNTKLTTLMTPRLKERYESEIKPRADRAVRLQEPDAGAAAREDHAQHGRRRGEARHRRCSTPPRSSSAIIAGQKPAVRRARKSIANFKLREGMPVGVKVTLRGDRMWEMLDRLQSIAIPRIRDFRGLNPRSFDGRGNYSIGIREQIIFPEIDYDSIDQVRGPGHHDHDHGRDRRGGVRAAAAARHAVPPAEPSEPARARPPEARREAAGREAERSAAPRPRPAGRGPQLKAEQSRQTEEADAADRRRPQPEAPADEPAADRRRESNQEEQMAKTSQMIRQQRGSKYQTRNYNRCRRCGRAARLLPQVRPLPDLPARDRARGHDPRHDEVVLVAGPATTDELNGLSSRLPDPHPQRPQRRPRRGGDPLVAA